MLSHTNLLFNPIQANIPFMKRPESWLLQAKYVKKHLYEIDILSKDAGLKSIIDPAPFLANLFLYFSKFKFFKQLVSPGCFQIYKHGVARFNNVSAIKF